MSWIDRLAATERSRDKWLARAKDRLLIIRDQEVRIQQLERANAALVVEAQFWEQRCKSISAELARRDETEIAKCEVIKKTRGFGES